MQTYVNAITFFMNVSKLVSDLISTSNLFHSTGAA